MHGLDTAHQRRRQTVAEGVQPEAQCILRFQNPGSHRCRAAGTGPRDALVFGSQTSPGPKRAALESLLDCEINAPHCTPKHCGMRRPAPAANSANVRSGSGIWRSGTRVGRRERLGDKPREETVNISAKPLRKLADALGILPLPPWGLLLKPGHPFLRRYPKGRPHHRLDLIFQLFGPITHPILDLVLTAPRHRLPWGPTPRPSPPLTPSNRR